MRQEGVLLVIAAPPPSSAPLSLFPAGRLCDPGAFVLDPSGLFFFWFEGVSPGCAQSSDSETAINQQKMTAGENNMPIDSSVEEPPTTRRPLDHKRATLLIISVPQRIRYDTANGRTVGAGAAR